MILLAGALLAAPPPVWPLWRLRTEQPASPIVLIETDGPMADAAAYDLLAVCLRAGLSTAGATAVVSESCPERLAAPLRRVAELLALGTEASVAWSRGIGDEPRLADLAALVRRSSTSGAAFADGLDGLAAQRRDEAQATALAAAERAGVQISGPLGLCFLPAFVCLGIAPVVIGLASSVLGGV
nr:type II secretion system F family protein [Gordonia araii]